MIKKKEKTSPPPVKPIIVKASDFSLFYATGAIGNFTPFDYRLTFYTHSEQWPKEPVTAGSVPIAQSMRATVIMSPELVKRLRDLLDAQLKQREKPPESKNNKKVVAEAV